MNELQIGICKDEFEAIYPFDMRWNPLDPDEDIWLPIRAGDISPRIEVLGS